jgi:NAD(P)-dependent dehydrogenase (short-subunit alcohol dehydrogenase family)
MLPCQNFGFAFFKLIVILGAQSISSNNEGTSMAKILITGATGGFGYLTTKQLISEGHQVVGTARDLTGRNKTKADELEKIGSKMVEMDMTQETSVNKGVDQAIEKLGGLDVLINNAGVGVIGLAEAFTVDDFKRVFEVNVFGVHRAARAALPYMRKSNKGLMVNISSLLGRMTVPFYGPYNASKWALEALTENYRTEVSQSNIEVCIVEPGGFPTTFIDNLIRPSDKARTSDYGAMGEMAEGFLKGFEQALASNPLQSPINVAVAIANLVKMPHGSRPFRTIVDKMGMGDPLGDYNTNLSKITEGVYHNFGIGHLLKVKAI